MPKQNSDIQQDPTESERYHDALYQLLDQISRRDQKIHWINGENKAAYRAVEEMKQTLAEREALLQFTEGQLNQVLESRAWKIAASIQQIRLFLAPPQSRRARILERALNSISFPFRKN